MFSLEGPQFGSFKVTVLPDYMPSTRHVTCLPVLASTDGPHFALDGLLLTKVDEKERYRRIGRFTVQLPVELAKSYLEKLQVSAQFQTNNQDSWGPMSNFVVE